MDGGREGEREGWRRAKNNKPLPTTQPPSHQHPPPPSLSKRNTYNPLSLFFLKNKITGEISPKTISNFKNELILGVSIARSEQKNSKIQPDFYSLVPSL
jgi:hypothetical protein